MCGAGYYILPGGSLKICYAVDTAGREAQHLLTVEKKVS